MFSKIQLVLIHMTKKAWYALNEVMLSHSVAVITHNNMVTSYREPPEIRQSSPSPLLLALYLY